MNSQEYVVRKALNRGKNKEEIAKEYCVDIEYVEELMGTEYQKPQHNFATKLNETQNAQEADEIGDEGYENEENGQSKDDKKKKIKKTRNKKLQ